MPIVDQLREILEKIITAFPHCNLVFLAAEDGLTMSAKGKKVEQHKAFSAILGSVWSQVKKGTQGLDLGELRSALFVTDQGFFHLISINNSCVLGFVTDQAVDYRSLFPSLREAARKIQELLILT